MINLKKFFDNARFSPFPGKLNGGQVQGCEYLIREFDRRGHDDLRRLAYILATTKHETAHTMQPIREGGGEAYLRSKRYYPWYGRGYVQLTWHDNYKRFQPDVLRLFEKDILANPDNAMYPPAAAYIIFEGMYLGSFTGKKLGDYFTDTMSDHYNARQIVNRMDRAIEIAGISKQFHSCLVSAMEI